MPDYPNWLRRAYKYGVATRDHSYEDIVYNDMAPSWIFDDWEGNEVFEMGRQGCAVPTYVTGWRYGHLPEDGRSFNHREGRFERGVSVMALDGQPYVRTLSMFGIQHRPVVRVGGWLHTCEVGGDGEPLLIDAVELGVVPKSEHAAFFARYA